MNDFNCGCRFNCSAFAVIASIVIGFITTILRLTAVITVGPAFLWVVLGIAVVYLGLTLLKADTFTNAGSRGCICTALNTLFAGILGSVLTAVILLAIEFVATSIIGAIITGALLLFISLVLTSTVCLVKCIANCSDND